MKEWVLRNRRILMLKGAVGCALAAAQIDPDNKVLALAVNLTWLFLF